MPYVKPFYHFSVDDVFGSLIEITDKNMQIFEHPFFAFLQELHTAYGVNIDLYLFYESDAGGTKRGLSEVTSRIRSELAHAPWLRFGPHALNYGTAPYAQTPAEQEQAFDAIYREIDRFASGNARSHWVRLHYFSESYELASYFKTCGVQMLFTTDKPVLSHRMPSGVKEALQKNGMAEYNGMRFMRTHFRAENFANDGITRDGIRNEFSVKLRDYGFITILTHEYEIPRAEVRDSIRGALSLLGELGVHSV